MRNMKIDTFGNQKHPRRVSVSEIAQMRVDYHKQYRHELIEFMSFRYDLRREEIMIMILRSGFDVDWFMSFPKYTSMEIHETAKWIYDYNGGRVL